MNKLFDELFNTFGFSNVLNEVEIVGFKYKDKDGVHDVVFNKELWGCNCDDNCDDDCKCECHNNTVQPNELTVDYVKEYFLRDEMSLRHENSVAVKLEDLKDGDYVYVKSDNSAFFGIFSHTANDVIYFYATICNDNNEEAVVAYNDCCLGVNSWTFYYTKPLEGEFVDTVLAEDGWRFDNNVKKFNLADRV